MWDPNIGLGTVTHQNIGYLFPMGPYYWVLHLLGVPAWVAQRLWLGSILFAAGARRAVPAAHAARARSRRAGRDASCSCSRRTRSTSRRGISVILLPWAGAAVDVGAHDPRAARGRGWRVPGDLRHRRADRRRRERDRARVRRASRPVLWIRTRVCVTREVDVATRARGHVARIGLLTLRHVAVVDRRALGAERLRAQHPEVHRDAARRVAVVDAERGAARPRVLVLLRHRPRRPLDRGERADYTQNLGLLVGQLRDPGARAARRGDRARWRHRAYFVVLVRRRRRDRGRRASRTTTRRSSAGCSSRSRTSSSFGLALRSTSRAVPLVALGLAVLLGVGVNALGVAWQGRAPGARRAGPDVVVAGVLIVLAVVNLPALWTGTFYTRGPHPRRGHPAVLDRRHRRRRRRLARHAGARDPRRRLRRVPLGPDRRPDHARADRPAVRGPRARAVGVAGVGRPAERARPPDAGGHARPVGARAGRPAA